MPSPAFPRHLVALATLFALSGCAYPGAIAGTAPRYPAGYQPVMGGYATSWPAQPGALWGPEDVASTDVFMQPLSGYGRWVQHPTWGVVFVPNVAADWRPYANGQWMEDRFWLSADPWGWATDHYGRWGYDPNIGWAWVPGTQWGPSWVAWREADDVVGWAPIPPMVNWSVGVGFSGGWGYGAGWDAWNSWYGPSWIWVPRQSVFLRGFGGRILPWNSGFSYWGRSHWQHTPYWGWNRAWDRSWGWHAPAGVNVDRGGNWGGGPRSGWGWSGGSWNGGNWNRDRRPNSGSGGWNGGQPNRPPVDRPPGGRPPSVSEQIGGAMTGAPMTQRPDGGPPPRSWGNATPGSAASGWGGQPRPAPQWRPEPAREAGAPRLGEGRMAGNWGGWNNGGWNGGGWNGGGRWNGGGEGRGRGGGHGRGPR